MSQYVVITGVSSGIGLYTAKKFAEQGFHVFGSVRKESDGVEAQKVIGDNFTPLLFDVTDHEGIQRGADQVKEIIGDSGLSCLINNAGIAVSGPLMLLSVEDYQRQFDVNVFGLIKTTQAFLPMLGARKDSPHPPGKIFNISSVAGKMVFPFMTPYSASKHAVEAISHGLRRELLMYGIDVIIIGPGAIKTPIWSKAEEVSEEVLQSDYGSIVSRFRKAFLKEEEEALPVEQLADKIYGIFKSGNPKTRYSILNKKFTKWILPHYVLSDRALDGFIKKMLKL